MRPQLHPLHPRLGHITGGHEAAIRRRREVTSLVSWPRCIQEPVVEKVMDFRVHISEDLTWTLTTTQLVKKARQRLGKFSRAIKNPRLLPEIFRADVITSWYDGSTTAELLPASILLDPTQTSTNRSEVLTCESRSSGWKSSFRVLIRSPSGVPKPLRQQQLQCARAHYFLFILQLQ